jgi:hypothetical protein
MAEDADLIRIDQLAAASSLTPAHQIVVQAGSGPAQKTDLASLAMQLNAQGVGQSALAPFDHVQALPTLDVNVGPFPAVYVGGAGSVVLRLVSGEELAFSDCFAGQVIEVPGFDRVVSGTTATNLVGLSRLQAPVFVGPTQILPIAPSNADIVDGWAGSVFVGVGGSVTLRAIDNSEAIFANVPSSYRLRVRTRQIRTATTAVNLLGLY